MVQGRQGRVKNKSPIPSKIVRVEGLGILNERVVVFFGESSMVEEEEEEEGEDSCTKGSRSTENVEACRI